MIGTLVTLSVTMAHRVDLSPGLEPWVAYSCRYYNAAGSTKTSYHQIYISDIRGGHRQQLTSGASERTDVRWVGDHQLAWLETDGVSKDETIYGYHYPTTKDGTQAAPAKLILYDLRSGKKTVLDKGKFRTTADYEDTFGYPRGTAVYFKYAEVQTQDSTEITYDGCDVVTPGSLKKLKTPPKPLYGDLGAGEGGSGPESPDPWSALPLDSGPKDAGKVKVPYRDYDSEDSSAVEVTFKGSKVLVPADNKVDYVWKATDASKAYVLEGSYAGSAGCDQWVFEIDWKTQKWRLIADDVLALDFDPGCRYWASSSNNKTTYSLGKLQVWQRELWCGDIETGKQWKVAEGAVHGDSARVQPIL